MGREATFATLEARLQNLLDALAGAHTTVVADQPLEAQMAHCDAPALVDILGDSVEDLVGRVTEALDAARGCQAAMLRGDVDGVRRALAACHTQTGTVAQLLFTELLSYERVSDLARVGRTRGGEWRPWAASVKQALDSCRQPLFEFQQAQLECWQEVTERSGHTVPANMYSA